MLKKTFTLLLLFTLLSQTVSLAQTNDTVRTVPPSELNINSTALSKKILYRPDIDVTGGWRGTMYEDQEVVLVGFSGLIKGARDTDIPVRISPCPEAFFGSRTLFDVKILQTRIEGDSVLA